MLLSALLQAGSVLRAILGYSFNLIVILFKNKLIVCVSLVLTGIKFDNTFSTIMQSN